MSHRERAGELRVGDVVENLNRIRVPLSRIQRKRRQGPYRYFGAQGVIDYVDDFLFDGEYVLVAEDGENLRSRKQPIARLVTGRFWVNNHAHVLKVRDDLANDRFVVAAINSADLGGLVTGAAQPKLTKANLELLPLPPVPKAAQDRIAAVLAAFDELIAINERRVELLEDLARSLHRAWFEKFRFPGHSTTPERLTDWRDARIGDLAEAVTDGVDPSDVAINTPYCGLEHLPRRATTLRDFGEARSVVSRKLRFRKGDTLFGKIRPYFHKVVWSPFDGVASSDAIVFRARREAPFPALLTTILASDAVVAEAVATSNGTKMPRADPKAILNYRLALPPLDSDLLRRAEAMMRDSYDLAAHLAGQNHALARTRDLLLPRLVTGQLDIADVDLGALTPAEVA